MKKIQACVKIAQQAMALRRRDARLQGQRGKYLVDSGEPQCCVPKEDGIECSYLYYDGDFSVPAELQAELRARDAMIEQQDSDG